jgi:hypothetical protein
MTVGRSVLGYKVKDVVTGLIGIATGHVVYLSDCNQVLVNPGLDKDGKLQNSHWIDEQRLSIIGGKSAKKIELDNTKTPGFDQEPPRR